MLRPGKAAAPADAVDDKAPADAGNDKPSSSGAARKAVTPGVPIDPAWFAAPTVKVIIVMLVIFFFLHLFMWYIVYGHMRDRFDDSLLQSARLAWAKVREVADHL
jgi:hypothetical protein